MPATRKGGGEDGKERGLDGPIKIKVIHKSTRTIDVELYASHATIDAFCKNEWIENIAPGESKETTFRTCDLGKEIGRFNYLLMEFQAPRSQGWLGHSVSVVPINVASTNVFTVTDLDAARVKVDRATGYP